MPARSFRYRQATRSTAWLVAWAHTGFAGQGSSSNGGQGGSLEVAFGAGAKVIGGALLMEAGVGTDSTSGVTIRSANAGATGTSGLLKFSRHVEPGTTGFVHRPGAATGGAGGAMSLSVGGNTGAGALCRYRLATRLRMVWPVVQ